MFELIWRGGWALWVITGCSIISLAVSLERWISLRRADVDSDALLKKVSDALEHNDISDAMEICAQAGGPIAETLSTGLRKLLFLERIGKKPEEIEAGIVAAMEDHGGHVIDFLERGLTTLATVASLAPILGMLGTVVGMIQAFGSIAQAGAMTPESVGQGIAQALLCTGGGLIVAAMATVEYNYFTTRVNRFVLQVQAAGTALVERVLDAQSRAQQEKA
jgi:biopolymer transport protein ExbB